jgi:hypothetical protein
MTPAMDMARRYYRLGLAAAKRRDLGSALRYADLACLLKSLGRAYAPNQSDMLHEDGEPRQDNTLYQGGMPHEDDEPEPDDMSRLAEICRYELGNDAEGGLEQVAALAGQKKWQAAAAAAKAVPRQTVRLLNIQGCLWYLAKRYAYAADCFANALAKDRGNRLAADALVEIRRQRKYFWRFF